MNLWTKALGWVTRIKTKKNRSLIFQTQQECPWCVCTCPVCQPLVIVLNQQKFPFPAEHTEMGFPVSFAITYMTVWLNVNQWRVATGYPCSNTVCFGVETNWWFHFLFPQRLSLVLWKYAFFVVSTLICILIFLTIIEKQAVAYSPLSHPHWSLDQWYLPAVTQEMLLSWLLILL